jgi:hypothetical protein
VGDRISGLEDKVDKIEKNEYIEKIMKKYEWNM